MRKILFALIAALCAPFAFAQTGGGSPPLAFFCSTTCSHNLALGQSLAVVKQSGTTRSSTSTLTVDPDLQIVCPNCLQAQVYVHVFYNIATAANGAKFQAFYGTLGSCTGSGGGETTAYGQLTSISGQLQDWNANPFANTSGTGNFFFEASGHVTGTNALLNVCWAQQVSGATNLQVLTGSMIVLTRIQ